MLTARMGPQLVCPDHDVWTLFQLPSVFERILAYQCHWVAVTGRQPVSLRVINNGLIRCIIVERWYGGGARGDNRHLRRVLVFIVAPGAPLVWRYLSIRLGSGVLRAV